MLKTLLLGILVILHLPTVLNAGPLARIYICPRDVGLVVGANQQFSLCGEDSDGCPVSPGTVTWSASSASGSITSTGLFTAGSNIAKYPGAITATAGGFTATADVEVYSPQPQAGYALERSIGCLSAGALSGPREIAFDAAGNAYIICESANSVDKFSSSGVCVAQFKLLSTVTDRTLLAVTPNGTMYVADPEAFCIRKYDPSGNFVTQWGTEGSGNGQFYDLTDIAVDPSGQVYVADAGKCCIDAFSANGAFLRSWPTPTHAYFSGYSIPPGAIAVDTHGHIWAWVSSQDFDWPELQEYDNQGNLLSWGPAWFDCAYRHDDYYGVVPVTFPMAIDDSGCAYQVCGGHVTKIYEYDAGWYDLSTSWTLSNQDDGTLGAAAGMALGPSGNVYVTDNDNNRVQIYDPDGQFLTSWRSSGSDKGQLKYPCGIGVDSYGNIYVSDTGNRRVQVFDSNGGFVRELASQQQLDDPFAWPSGLTFDAQGNLYVADCANPRILVYGSGGSLSSIWTVPCLFGTAALPMGLIRNPSSGNLYLADAGYRMDTFESNGVYECSWMNAPGTGDGWVQSPAGIALDSLGLAYISDYGNNRIQKCNSGVFQMKWGTSGTGSGQFQGPAGICIDSSDNVYVADSGNCRIQKFSNSGAFLSQLGSGGFGAFQFTDPESVAVDAAGNLYVADTGNHRILKFKRVIAVAVTITGPTDASTYSTTRSTVDLSGTASSGTLAISWSSDRGGSGSCSGTTTWAAPGVPLKTGSNVITVTARDASGLTATDTITVTASAPSVTVTSPTTYQSYLATALTMSIAGTAASSVSLVSVTWSNDRGGNGTCSGTTSWTANNVTVQTGRNNIRITVKDSNLATASTMLVVIRPRTAATTISAAKQNAGGADVYLTDQSVTGILNDCFYIEQTDRVSALKVVLPYATDLKSIGSTVDVGGTINIGADGERYIDGAAKTKS